MKQLSQKELQKMVIRGENIESYLTTSVPNQMRILKEKFPKYPPVAIHLMIIGKYDYYLEKEQLCMQCKFADPSYRITETESHELEKDEPECKYSCCHYRKLRSEYLESQCSECLFLRLPEEYVNDVDMYIELFQLQSQMCQERCFFENNITSDMEKKRCPKCMYKNATENNVDDLKESFKSVGKWCQENCKFSEKIPELEKKKECNTCEFKRYPYKNKTEIIIEFIAADKTCKKDCNYFSEIPDICKQIHPNCSLTKPSEHAIDTLLHDYETRATDNCTQYCAYAKKIPGMVKTHKCSSCKFNSPTVDNFENLKDEFNSNSKFCLENCAFPKRIPGLIQEKKCRQCEYNQPTEDNINRVLYKLENDCESKCKMISKIIELVNKIKCPNCKANRINNTSIYEAINEPMSTLCQNICKNTERIQKFSDYLEKRIPSKFRYAKISFGDLEDKDKMILKEYVEHFEEHHKKGKGIIIFGDTGCGKTTTLIVLQKVLALKYDIYPLYYFGPDLYKCIKNQFNTRNNHRYDNYYDDYDEDKDLIEFLKTLDILTIDDIGAERPTEWTREVFCQIIDSRYRNNRTTFFATNCSPDELASKIGERSFSRIMGMCIKVLFDSYPDYRI